MELEHFYLKELNWRNEIDKIDGTKMTVKKLNKINWRNKKIEKKK